MQITSHLFLLIDYFYRIVHINCLVLSKLATNVSSKSWISSVRRQMSNPVPSCTRVTRKVSPLNVSECPIACCNSFLPLMEISQNHFIAIATMPILPISIKPLPVCPILLPWHDSGLPFVDQHFDISCCDAVSKEVVYSSGNLERKQGFAIAKHLRKANLVNINKSIASVSPLASIFVKAKRKVQQNDLWSNDSD